MITERDLQEAIAECEGQRNPTASTCVKLAAFYAVRDRLYPAAGEPRGYSAAPAPLPPVGEAGESDFLLAIAGMDAGDLIPVMDELMGTLRVVSPRIYAGVMRRLAEMNGQR